LFVRSISDEGKEFNNPDPRTELYNIQQSLSTGEQEKVELMKNLACIKDDLTRLQVTMFSGVYIGKGGTIMPATMTRDSDTLVLAFATLGGTT
jgi:hypothetical protein